MTKKIFKVAGVEIKDDKFLMVRKVGKDVWTNLGGKTEKDETNEKALLREVKEELNCKAEVIAHLGEFENKAAFDDAIVHLSVFIIKLKGKLEIVDEEIEEYKYIGQGDIQKGIKLPPSITEQVVPALLKDGYLNWRKT